MTVTAAPVLPRRVGGRRLLVARGLVETRQKAQGLVMAGQVRVGDRLVDKPGGTRMIAGQEKGVEVSDDELTVGLADGRHHGRRNQRGQDPDDDDYREQLDEREASCDGRSHQKRVR